METDSRANTKRAGGPQPTADGGRLFPIPDLSQEEFEALRSLIHERFGIDLTSQKTRMVSARLCKILAARGFTSFAQYYEFLQQDVTGDALAELANRISTNHTFFNRESDHFDFFRRTALPEAAARHLNAGNHDLRIWSAGCSSGEEPYTLVMLMLEHFRDAYLQWNAGVLATDISLAALNEARAGEYTSEELQALPQGLRREYFLKKQGNLWAVAECVRSEVTFRRFNLINQRFPFRQPFDVIFCRNVMIYFDKSTRTGLVRKFHEWLVPGGYLMIGHSETIPYECPLRYVAPAIYRKEA